MKTAIKLSDNEATLLKDMNDQDVGSEEYCWNFEGMRSFTRIKPDAIRRTVRALARKGLTVYVRGLFDDDGDLAGSGYGVTRLGREVAEGLGK